MRQKQGTDAHPERRGVGIALVRRSAVKRWLNHLYSSVLPCLCLPSGLLSDLFFHIWPAPGPSPGYACTPQPRWMLKWRLLGGARLITAWSHSLTLTHREPFCACVVSSLSWKSWGQRSLNPLCKQGFTSMSLPWLLPWLLPWVFP